MANHKQAIKRHKQSLVRRDRNNYYKSTMRTFVKRARIALASGDTAVATDAVKKASAFLDKVATKGAIPKTRASRVKSRLNQQLAALSK